MKRELVMLGVMVCGLAAQRALAEPSRGGAARAGPVQAGRAVAGKAPQEPPAAGQEEPARKAPQSPAELASARIAAAARAHDLRSREMQAGMGTPEDVYRWSVRWLEAQRDTGLSGPELKAAYQAHLARMTALEETVVASFQQGMRSAFDAAAVEYYRLEAAQWAARNGP